MNFINADKENSCNIDIYYEDYGSAVGSSMNSILGS
jgi:hypothetical protein